MTSTSEKALISEEEEAINETPAPEPETEQTDDTVVSDETEVIANFGPIVDDKALLEAQKFGRIRGLIQNLNKQYLTTIVENEQRYQTEINTLQNKLSEEKENCKDQIEALTKEFDGQIESLTNQNQEMKKKLAEEQENFKDQIKALTSQNQEFAEETKDLKDQMEIIKKQKEIISSTLSEKEELIETIRSDKGELFKRTEELQKETESLWEKNRELHKEIDNKNEESREATETLQNRMKDLQQTNNELEEKLATVLTQENEQLMLIKQASQKIKTLETREENHMAYVMMAGERISLLEAQAIKRNEELREMEAREEKVMALAKKATIKIKELEARDSKHTAKAMKTAEDMRKMKKMLLEKHDEIEAVQERALKELDLLAQQLDKVNQQRSSLQSKLSETTRQLAGESALRKAEQQKILSLKTMIEQYDGAMDGGLDLSQAFSSAEEIVEAPIVLDLLDLYKGSKARSPEEFKSLTSKILESTPDEVKKHFRQVGFFRANDLYNPVLVLGPFDVPPGSLRESWLEIASNSLIIYYYGQNRESLAYDLISLKEFIPYQQGVDRGLHILPTEIIDKKQADTLSPMEKVYVDGIKAINMEARAAEHHREHPLKNFTEDFGSTPRAVAKKKEREQLRMEVKERIMLASSFETKETRANLISELNAIEVEFTGKKPVQLRIDVASEPTANREEMDSQSVTSYQSHTSYQSQMHNYMEEIAVIKKECRDTNEIMEKIRIYEASGRGMEDQREDAPGARGSHLDSRPSFEKIPVDVVKERLKWVGSLKQQSDVAKKPVDMPSSGSNAKDMMEMWQQKTGGSTPKQGNTTPNKAFNFEGDCSKDNTGSNSTQFRCVTIPKNILKKIEVGEPLTNEERIILEGIQRHNNKESMTAVTSPPNHPDFPAAASSVSALTTEETHRPDDLNLKVTAE